MKKRNCLTLFLAFFLRAGVLSAAENVRLFVPEKIYAVPEWK